MKKGISQSAGKNWCEIAWKTSSETIPSGATISRCGDRDRPERPGSCSQVVRRIESLYPDRFVVAQMSCQGTLVDDDASDRVFFQKIPKLMLDAFDIDVEAPEAWEDWSLFFHKKKGLFDKPLILFIDEFDSLPSNLIDKLVGVFRDMYMKRESYFLHGLALIGVHAVLGLDSDRGSPFNVQRSMHVPNFAAEEVENLFDQYRRESGQDVDAEVVGRVFRETCGQPGLVGWFGELLTEKYNPGKGRTIDMSAWENVYQKALYKEWNNNVLNLIKKAQGEYAEYVLELFGRPDLPFSVRADWCAFLYLNGVIDEKTVADDSGRSSLVCKFSSPFVQKCLFDAFATILVGHRMPILALEPTDRVTDLFKKADIDLPGLLQRYKNFLKRLKAKGLYPWKGQPRRSDLRLTEAVGHFHLYSWLQNAVGNFCAVSPEFPTGNGRVDLHLECGGKLGIIEVKSFRDLAETENAVVQTAGYALKLGLHTAAMALFVPVEDEEVLKRLSGETVVDGVTVAVVAIGWL